MNFLKKKNWHLIKDALVGREYDYTIGSIRKAIFLLSVPMIIEMLMESIFAIVDIFFVSKLGADAIAVVGITESLTTIVYAIAFGLSTATSALISRRVGEKSFEKAKHIAVQAILTGFMISSFISIPALLYVKDILGLMGANANIVNTMSTYTSITLGSNVVIMFLFIINAIFRSAGNAALAMRVLLISNTINIILDPFLIFGIGFFPEWGVKGAAIATLIGRACGVLIQFYLLFFGKQTIKLHLQKFTLGFKTIAKILRLSLGAMGQNIIATSSWIFLMRIVSEFGSEATAGYTVAIRIIVFALLPSWGLSNAASTMVGQSLGAGNEARAERSVWIVSIINIVLLGMIGTVLAVFPSFFIELFTLENAIVQHGALALQIVSFGFIFYGLGMVLLNAINGAGDTKTPTTLNFISFWMIEIPLAYFFAVVLGWEQNGVFYAIPIAETSLTLLSLFYFRKGKWKNVNI